MKPSTLISSLLLASLSGATFAEDYPASWWPTATADSASTTSGTALTIPVLANDRGNGLTLSTVNATTTGNGSARLSTDKQSVIYTSASGFSGTDTFWYDFTDSQGRANAAKVTVEVSESKVTKPPQWPTAEYDTAETTTNTPINIAVLENDNGVALTLTQINTTTVKYGKAEINSDNKTIKYTPPTGYTGPDEFWYVFSDQWGRTNAGKITLSVKSPTVYNGGWPVAVIDDTDAFNTEAILIPVLSNDLGRALKLVEVNDWTKKGGRAKIEANQVRYTPPNKYIGEDYFWYNFEDDQGRTNSAKVVVNVKENTEQSTIAFCGVNYSTDGTKAGTYITQETITPSQDIGTVNVLPFPEQPTGDLAVIGDRRYYTINNGAGQGITLWVEQNGTRKNITTYPETFSFEGVGVFGDTLYFAATQENSNIKGLLSYNGITSAFKPLGEYPSPIQMLDNKSAPYFKYIGTNESNISGVHYLRIDEATHTAINVATEHYADYVNESIQRLFFINGIDYRSSSLRVRFSYSSDVSQKDSNGDELTSFPGSIQKAVISQHRLLFTTYSHTDVISTGNAADDNNTVYPAKLFAVGTANAIIELAVCE